MPLPVRSDRPEVTVTSPPADREPEGRLVRSTSRPGLTGTGVGVLGAAVGVVAAIVSELITDGTGWIFTIPFVLVSIYCAFEVAQNSLRSAIVMPPIVILIVALISPIWGNTSGYRGWIIKTIASLTNLAPTMIAATALAAAIVGWRYWRQRKTAPHNAD